MHKTASIAVSTAALAALTLNGGQAMAAGSTGAWPSAYPLLNSPGIVMSQSSTTAAVRSTSSVAVVKSKLDSLYVTQKGCKLRLAVNKPRDYLCHNSATGKTDEVYFTFAMLDPTAGSPYRSQSNAYILRG